MRFNFVKDVLSPQATSSPTNTALLCVPENSLKLPVDVISYQELQRQVDVVARTLLEIGIEKGDVVILIMHRCSAWWVNFLALIRIGAITSPAAVVLTPKEIIYRMNSCDAKMVIVAHGDEKRFVEDQTFIETINQKKILMAQSPWSYSLNYSTTHLPSSFSKKWFDFGSLTQRNGSTTTPSSTTIRGLEETNEEDPMILYFTSGTTGPPKMVVHNCLYSLSHEKTAKDWHGLGKSYKALDKKNQLWKGIELHWTITDTGWAKMAWGAFFGQLSAGAAIFVYDYIRFDPHQVFKMIEDYGITSFCAPPTAYRSLVKWDMSKYNLSSLRGAMSAGEPLNPEVWNLWKSNTGLEIREGYGQTETPLIIGIVEGEKAKPGTMGKALPHLVVQVINDQLIPCKSGEEGNIAIQVKPTSPLGLFQGYVKKIQKHGKSFQIEYDDQANAKVFQGNWYLTGDKAFLDDEGYFYFIGRNDDVIKTSGYRVGPFEVESSLVEHKAVLEAGVVGIPDPQKGQIIKAFVVLSQGFTPSEQLAKELISHVRNTTAHFKAPGKIEFVQTLPKTVSGKIRRVELRDMKQTSSKL